MFRKERKEKAPTMPDRQLVQTVKTWQRRPWYKRRRVRVWKSNTKQWQLYTDCADFIVVSVVRYQVVKQYVICENIIAWKYILVASGVRYLQINLKLFRWNFDFATTC